MKNPASFLAVRVHLDAHEIKGYNIVQMLFLCKIPTGFRLEYG